jgi:hypothetical protein
MVLNQYGLECLQGLLFGFATVGVLCVILNGISRLVKDSMPGGEDL